MFKLTVASCAFLFAAGVVQGVDVPGVPDGASIQNAKSIGWKASGEKLGAVLISSYKPTSSADPVFQKWSRLYQWCQFLDKAGYPVEGTPEVPIAIVEEFIGSGPLGAMLFQNLKPQDKPAEVLAILAGIRAKHATAFKTYPSLAVAIAVVFDTDVPRYWPHGQVKKEMIPTEEENVPAVDRFAFWAESADAGKLMLDLKKLEPEQVKFIVDTWVSRDELRWAQKNVRFPRTNFGQAFSYIKYDHPRLDAGKYDWQESSYSLAQIEKSGGICVDQAYFAATAGKARGLPTLYFRGDGNRGGHAWFGYMKSDDKWELNEGRYAYDNYATGEARDPQTGKEMTDHDLVYLSSRFRNRPEYASAQVHLRMADIFKGSNDAVRERQAVENAIRICPDDADGWDRRSDCLVAASAPPAEIRAHYEAAIRQFTKNADLKAEYSKKYAALLRSQGDEALASKVERSVMTANTKERTDLTLDTAKQKLNELVSEGKWEDAYKHYDWTIGRLGKTSSGPVFTDIVKPFISKLRKAGELDLALKAVRAATRDLDLSGGSDYPKELDAIEVELRQEAKNKKNAVRS